MKLFLTLILCVFVWPGFSQTIVSPNGKLSLSFTLTPEGEPAYQLSFGQKPVIKGSKLGIELKNHPSLISGFTVKKTDTLYR